MLFLVAKLVSSVFATELSTIGVNSRFKRFRCSEKMCHFLSEVRHVPRGGTEGATAPPSFRKGVNRKIRQHFFNFFGLLRNIFGFCNLTKKTYQRHWQVLVLFLLSADSNIGDLENVCSYQKDAYLIVEIDSKAIFRGQGRFILCY